MSTVRRSARLAAKASQSNQVPPPMEVVAEKPVEAPITAAVSTAEEHRKYCKPCEKQFIIREIQGYLDRISNLYLSYMKVPLVINLFNLIEEKIEFVCSSDFSDDDRFVTVICLKSIEMQDQLKNADISDEIRQVASTLLKRVHKKINLYLIKKEAGDEIYNEFLEKFIQKV
jgi:hypothetical protein